MVVTYRPRGNMLRLFTDHSPELVLAGPAGTGKSRSWLELLHLRAAKYPGSRHLVVRKTLQSLKSSTLVTFDERVQPQLDGVIFRGDTAKRPSHYAYPNGSVVVLGGMDKAIKVMSSEYDTIYVPECTELSESDWEALLTRLRNGKMPYQQLAGDCNPDAPTHWLRKRADNGRARLLESSHRDNPILWDDERGCWTPEGDRYLAVLKSLTGVRYARLFLGQWVAAEGMVYEDTWSRERNLIDRFPATPTNPRGDPPREWPRSLTIDFGFTHPFVCQWWAEDPDGRLYRYREIYHTRRLVEDHAKRIKEVSGWGTPTGDPLPRQIICDHDAEDRATLHRYLGMATLPAHKSVSDGIQAVASRFKPAGDGRARLFLLRDSLVDRDQSLVDHKQPTCTEEEVESYIWDQGAGRTRGEQPVKEHDHGMDAMRYQAAFKDLRNNIAQVGPSLASLPRF